MARPPLSQRVRSAPVARAMTSASGILVAAAGVSAGVLLALPPVAVVGLGAAAWGARVAVAVPRAPKGPSIDPGELAAPWRGYVQDALAAQARYRDAVARTPAGPLQERLGTIGERIDHGVDECWRVARHGQALAEARAAIDAPAVAAELERTEANAAERWAAGSDLARTVEALQAQLDAAERMSVTVADAESRLRLIDARLNETVTRAVELSVQAQDPTELRGLSDDVEGVVGDLEALRIGLAEADGDAPPASGR